MIDHAIPSILKYVSNLSFKNPKNFLFKVSTLFQHHIVQISLWKGYFKHTYSTKHVA